MHTAKVKCLLDEGELTEMPFPPAGQGCSTCFAWDDRGNPGVEGMCCRQAPFIAGMERFRNTAATEWCADGADKVSGVSYSSNIHGLPGGPLVSGTVALAAAPSTAVSIGNTGSI